MSKGFSNAETPARKRPKAAVMAVSFMVGRVVCRVVRETENCSAVGELDWPEHVNLEGSNVFASQPRAARREGDAMWGRGGTADD
jgi:hypothetical protein